MAEEPTPQQISFSDFLSKKPPGTRAFVKSIGKGNDLGLGVEVEFPTLKLWCDHLQCKDLMIHDCQDKNFIKLFESVAERYQLIRYWCRHCKVRSRVFAVAINAHKDGSADCIKFGELPSFGPPLSEKLLRLVGDDRETLLRGRQSENQGLGLGAFAYYRRVVENQKGKLFEEIEKVATTVGADADIISSIQRAAKETQFAKAMDNIKPGVPESLLIKGHNPLLLLHGALSEGLHAKTDEDCLALATDVRVILHELAERMSLALKDSGEVASALGRLAAAKSSNGKT
ncbi:MAG: hypothetical protein K2W85_07150 [Phycisphaerales bacterium]|nr:hypothetical protein [Phycisphaerales bacterium]